MTTKIISGTKTHLAQDGSTFNGCAKRTPCVTLQKNGTLLLNSETRRISKDSTHAEFIIEDDICTVTFNSDGIGLPIHRVATREYVQIIYVSSLLTTAIRTNYVCKVLSDNVLQFGPVVQRTITPMEIGLTVNFSQTQAHFNKSCRDWPENTRAVMYKSGGKYRIKLTGNKAIGSALTINSNHCKSFWCKGRYPELVGRTFNCVCKRSAIYTLEELDGGYAKVSKMPAITGYHNGYFSFGTGATKALVDNGLDNLPVTIVQLDGDTLTIEFGPMGTTRPSKQFKGKCRLLHVASMSKYDLARRKWLITDVTSNTITAKERLQ